MKRLLLGTSAIFALLFQAQAELVELQEIVTKEYAQTPKVVLVPSKNMPVVTNVVKRIKFTYSYSNGGKVDQNAPKLANVSVSYENQIASSDTDQVIRFEGRRMESQAPIVFRPHDAENQISDILHGLNFKAIEPNILRVSNTNQVITTTPITNDPER